MHIFLAYKFTDSDKQLLRETIEHISSNMESLGHETFCFFRDIQKWGELYVEKSEIMPIAFKNLDKCDVLLMIVTSEVKSTGMGIEAGYAKAKDKKIVLIKQSEVETDYLESLADKTVTFDGNLPTAQILSEALLGL